MDEAEARRLAVAEFGSRVARDPGEWDVAGPVVAAVRGPTGVKPHLIFTFTPREATSPSGFPLRIAVDPDTGKTDMLR
jgi:hypothetical protein